MHGEGLLCTLDPRLPTVVRAMTSSSRVGEFETWLELEDRTTALAALEHETLANAPRVHVATEALARNLALPATTNVCVACRRSAPATAPATAPRRPEPEPRSSCCSSADSSAASPGRPANRRSRG